jgi:hypothetical protein
MLSSFSSLIFLSSFLHFILSSLIFHISPSSSLSPPSSRCHYFFSFLLFFFVFILPSSLIRRAAAAAIRHARFAATMTRCRRHCDFHARCITPFFFFAAAHDAISSFAVAVILPRHFYLMLISSLPDISLIIAADIRYAIRHALDAMRARCCFRCAMRASAIFRLCWRARRLLRYVCYHDDAARHVAFFATLFTLLLAMLMLTLALLAGAAYALLLLIRLAPLIYAFIAIVRADIRCFRRRRALLLSITPRRFFDTAWRFRSDYFAIFHYFHYFSLSISFFDD